MTSGIDEENLRDDNEMTSSAVPPHWKSGGEFWEIVYEHLSAPGVQDASEQRKQALDQLNEIHPRFVVGSAELKQLRQSLVMEYGVQLRQYATQISASIEGEQLKALPEIKRVVEQFKRTDVALDIVVIDALKALRTRQQMGYFLSGPLFHAIEKVSKESHPDSLDSLLQSLLAAIKRLASEDGKALKQISDSLTEYTPGKVVMSKPALERLSEFRKIRRAVDAESCARYKEWLKVLADVYGRSGRDDSSKEQEWTDAQKFFLQLAELVGKNLRYKPWYQASGCENAEPSSQVPLVDLKELERATTHYLWWLKCLHDVDFLRNQQTKWKEDLELLMKEMESFEEELAKIQQSHEASLAIELRNEEARKLVKLLSKDLREMAENDERLRSIITSLRMIALELEKEQLSIDDKPRRLLNDVLQPVDDIVFAANNNGESEEGKSCIQKFRSKILEEVCAGGYEELNEESLGRRSLVECFELRFFKYDGDSRDLANKSLEEVLRPGYWMPQTKFISKRAEVRIR